MRAAERTRCYPTKEAEGEGERERGYRHTEQDSRAVDGRWQADCPVGFRSCPAAPQVLP